MPFSTSFCLTNTGNIPVGSLINFYSNTTSYLTPFQTNIQLSNITGSNCPYILTDIPDGTSSILIKDVNSVCCTIINVSANTICDLCELGFDIYSSSTISTIVAGNLTGSCDSNITDYLVFWYEVNNLTTPVFTSGHGTEFTPYGFPHPLTGLGSVPVLTGEYVPVIRKIKLNGVNYSNQFETGFVQASLNCFDNVTVQVESFTCSNGDQTGDYDHLIRYSGASVDIAPPSVQSTFELSQTTNYFVWRFNGFDIPDSVKIVYYGSHYDNTPITLEYYNVGGDNVGIDLNLTPKVIETYNGGPGFNKVTCLTGLTRSVNDFLVLEIVPNQTNNVTNYSMEFSCLEEFDCETCFNTYLNTPYKIIGSSITGVTQDCNIINIKFQMSGCSLDDLRLTDIWKYYYTQGLNRSPYVAPGIWGTYGNIVQSQVTLYNNLFACYFNDNYRRVPCGPTTQNEIVFTKDNSGIGGIGNIHITFNNVDDFNAYYNSYLYQISVAGIITNDNTDINYYKYLRLQVPDYRNTVSPEYLGCGDGTNRIDYIIHTSSIVTTGLTSGSYSLNITMPTITNGMTFTECQNGCTVSVNNVVSYVNGSTTSGNQTYTNFRGSRVSTPFYWTTLIFTNLGSNISVGSIGYEWISSYYNETRPMSGSTYTVIPELSAQTCTLYGNVYGEINSLLYQKHQYDYRIALTNPTNSVSDFKIDTKIIINGATTGSYILIYQIQNGVVIYSDPNYII